ncbi:MAG TPA: hypothetical protein VF719_00445 [Abditibacteriaceae bacterium]|jgi:hypothetical protein
MKEMKNGFVALAFALALYCTTAPAFARPRQDALLKNYAAQFFGPPRKNATQETFNFVGRAFAKNGASVRTQGHPNKALNLDIKPYTDIINMYDHYKISIDIAAMPTPAQSEAYWKNWSHVLTRDKWNYKKFFRNRKEMHALARYNVIILTAHEYGHYFDYRYNINHTTYEYGTSLMNAPLNCTEYFADKFAVAFIHYLAGDNRFAALRTRYYQLINSFNASIPKENRVKFLSFEQLEGSCGEIDLLANGRNDDGSVNNFFFRTYASAYFTRHKALLDRKKSPPLREFLRRTLKGKTPQHDVYVNGPPQ